MTGDLTPTIPRWEPVTTPTPIPLDNAIGSLWDYFGFPTAVDPKGAYPLDFPRRAIISCITNIIGTKH